MWIGKNSLPAGGGGRIGTFCSLFSSVFFPITFVEKNPLARSADALVLIWEIDLTLAWALPRNVRRTDAPLKASDDKTPSTSGLLDLHASGKEELTSGRLNCKKNRQ